VSADLGVRAAVRHRPTVAVVDLDAVRHNAAVLRPESAELIAIVKADAYGHGAVPVARAATSAGATRLGVALVEEGVELRAAGLEVPILTLTEFPPGSEGEALRAGLTPTLYTTEALGRLLAASGGHPVAAQVKVDTGMHRVGVAWERAAPFVAEVVRAGVALDGVWTHLADAEVPDDPFTGVQLERFRRVLDEVGAAGIRPGLVHAANSAGRLARPDAWFDAVRVGVALYGVSPGPGVDDDAAALGLRPALSLRSAVSFVKRLPAGEAVSYGLTHRLERDATVATVPVGYADGYPRALSNRGDALIRGSRRRVIGSVTMDQLLVDCGDDAVDAGEEVILLGRQGGEEITAAELAERAGTIPYEIVCRIGVRVPREYVGT
jgi:alanine racemase